MFDGHREARIRILLINEMGRVMGFVMVLSALLRFYK